MNSSIEIYAGKTAFEHIKNRGLTSDDIKVMAGASGGPKWFTLFGLDKYLFGQFFRQRTSPLYTIGSSAGAWRMACFAQKDPVAAISRLADLYSTERYSEKPDVNEISDKAIALLNCALGEHGCQDIAENSIIQSHFIVARAKGLLAFEHPILQISGIVQAATLNALSQRTLGLSFQRYVFFNQNKAADFNHSHFEFPNRTTRYLPLSEANIQQVLLASGAIPLVLRGIKDIPGSDKGIYRDGGIVDYHLDINFGNEGLVLYPHFFPCIKPGWFDKNLKYRKAHAEHFHNVVLVTPSKDHIEKLPFGKISDRNDFTTLDTETRIRYWSQVLSESERMADDFAALVDKQNWLDHLRPIEPIL